MKCRVSALRMAFGSQIRLEPASRNWPRRLRWSTSKRAASHNCGASCHSSRRRDGLPYSCPERPLIDSYGELVCFAVGAIADIWDTLALR